MTREIIRSDWDIQPVEADLVNTEDLFTWLIGHAQVGDYLLAHSLDGVTWGRFEQEDLLLSSDFAPDISPALELAILQSLRVFNADQELHLWRDEDNWHAKLAYETPDGTGTTIVEQHILWGTQGLAQDDDFTLLEMGAQGLRHIVPIDATQVNDKQIRARLWLHHQCMQNPDSGVTCIAYSRLAGIEV